MNKCVLFDFDGVIIHSEPIIKAAFTLSYRDVIGEGEPPVQEYLKHMGDSFDNIMRKMGLPSKMYESFSHYSTRLTNLIEIFPGIEDVLRKLKNRGIKLGLVTGKDRRRTLELLNHFDIAIFDVIVAGDDVELPKPHPQPILMALAAVGIAAKDAMMIGDSPNDLISARRAFVESCAVGWGIGSRMELENENPNYFVDTPDEIMDVLEEYLIQSALGTT